MKNTLYLIILSITGCGAAPFKVDSRIVDPAFIPYVQEFVYEAKARSVQLNFGAIQKLSIQFDSNTVFPILAQCKVYPDRLEIVVNPPAWDSASKAARELLLNHEMGHCILGKMAHNDTKITFYSYYDATETWAGPASLMNTYVIPASIYAINRNYYLNELFNVYDNSVLYYNGPSNFDASQY